MTDCADVFGRSRNASVEVIKGPPEAWLDRRAAPIYGSFPAMLSGLAPDHPKALDARDICGLYQRRIWLLVRRGTPAC